METLCQNEIKTELLKTPAKPDENAKNDIITNILNPSGNEFLTPIIKIGRVYLITNLINNKKYIGVTTKFIERRFKEHVWESKRKKLMAICFAIKKYGEENFKIELVEECLNITEGELLSKETFYIDKYNTLISNGCGYNAVRCYDGRLIFSEETKQKISLNHANMNGNKNPFYGKHHTKEMRQRWSEWKKKYKSGKNHPIYGKHRSENTKRKISLSLKGKYVGEMSAGYGRKASEEAKKKMSLSQKGKRLGIDNPNVNKTQYHFRNIHTGEDFVGIKCDFFKKYNLKSQSVSSLINGIRKSLHGWTVVNEA